MSSTAKVGVNTRYCHKSHLVAADDGGKDNAGGDDAGGDSDDCDGINTRFKPFQCDRKGVPLYDFLPKQGPRPQVTSSNHLKCITTANKTLVAKLSFGLNFQTQLHNEKVIIFDFIRLIKKYYVLQ